MTIYKLGTNKFFHTLFGRVLCLLAFVFFVSCTGEIESVDIRETEAAQTDNTTLIFEGIFEANAISDSKIEVFFKPAIGGEPGKEKVYLINITEVALPITLPEGVLEKEYRGYLKYTITGLDIGKSYTIGIDVRNEGSEFVRKTDRRETITTFDNYVADFVGVSSLMNASGPIGSDSIVVRWGSPTIFNSGEQTNGNVDYLEVTAIDRSKLTPADMNNRSLGSADGRYTKTVPYDTSVFQTTFRGLPSNSKFNVQVRAIHITSVDDIYNPNLRSELNTNYMTISTLNEEFTGLGEFSADSFVVEKANGKLALSSVDVRWGAVDAVFDHYRIYYAEKDTVFDPGANIPLDCSSAVSKLDGMDVYCKRVDYDTTGSSLSSLKKLTEYNYTLALCLNFTCDGSDRIVLATTESETTPTLANFAGLTSVTPSAGAESLGKMLLNFPKVSFNGGYFDGFIIEMSNDSLGYSGNVVISDNYAGSLAVREYDYLIDTQIVVDNVSYADASIPYCFTIYPYLYDADGVKESYPNNVWKCAYPDLAAAAPRLADFSGFNLGLVNENDVTLRWFPPAAGVYTHFEVFYRKTSGAFNLSEAISETTVDFNFTNYERVLFAAEDGASTYVKIIPNLEAKAYQFGVVTYFAGSNGIIRSELNNGVLTCDVSNSPSECTGN